MIKFITNADIANEDFLNSRKKFFENTSKIGFPPTENSIHPQRQVQYPYIDFKDELLGTEKILDAGCGYTVWPYYIKQQYPDTEIHLVDSCKPRLDRYGELFIKKEADLASLPYGDNFFDVIYCISTLEHITEWKKVLSEFNRVVKPNGKLIMLLDGFTTENYFKEKDTQEMIEILRKSYIIDFVDLDMSDAWLFSNSAGSVYSLAVFLQADK